MEGAHHSLKEALLAGIIVLEGEALPVQAALAHLQDLQEMVEETVHRVQEQA